MQTLVFSAMQKALLHALNECLNGWTDDKGTTYEPGTALRFNWILWSQDVSELAEWLPAGLTSLDLSRTLMRSYSLKVLAERLPVGLTSLDLSGNDIGSNGLKVLAERLPARLTSLSIGNNGIGHSGVKALAARLPVGLTSLNLNGNYLRDNGVKELAERLPEELSSICLAQNRFGYDGVNALAERLPAGLTLLDLSGNEINNRGVKVLAARLPAGLTSLDLSWNGIGDDGVKALAQRLPEAVTEVHLDGNRVGDSGAMAILSRLDELPQLRGLSLTDNQRISLPDAVLHENRFDPHALRDAFFAQMRAKAAGQFALVAKAVVLGNGRGGKTHLAEWLVWKKTPEDKRGEEPELQEGRDPTHAFNQYSFLESINLDNVQHDLDLNLYDFGGQVEIHGAHRFFMSDKRNLFIILVSGAHRDGQSARVGEAGRTLEYYLRMAHHHGPEQPVIVVVGWADQESVNGEHWPNLEDLQKIHKNTKIVHGYSNAGGQGIEEVAKAIHDAVNQPEMAEQIRQPAGDFFVTAREGIRAKDAAMREGRNNELGYIWARIASDDEPSWYAKLFDTNEYTGKDKYGLARSAILMLRDMGEVHFVGDRIVRLGEYPGRRPHLHGVPPATTAEHAADRLNDVFFNPRDIKQGVYNVLRAGGASTTGVLSEREVRDRLAERGLDQGRDQNRVIQLMEACELIYPLVENPNRPGVERRWLVPDHLGSASESTLRELIGRYHGMPFACWELPFVPDAVLWRYLGPMFSDVTRWDAGTERPLYRNVGEVVIDGIGVLLVADADGSTIKAYADPKEIVNNQRLKQQVSSDLDRALGAIGTLHEVKPSRKDMLRGASIWLDSLLASHSKRRHERSRPDDLLADRYLLTNTLGAGGFGLVYKAMVWGTADLVTIKATPYVGQNDPAHERAKLEYNTTRWLKPGVDIRLPRAQAEIDLPANPDAGHDVAMYIVVREYIDGRPIDQWASGKPWSEVHAAFVQACEGVAELHELGVQHLDLKPSNILVDDTGKAWVIDLGAARDAGRLSPITEIPGNRPATKDYQAPEDWPEHDDPNAERKYQLRDVYALGLVLSDLLRDAVITDQDQFKRLDEIAFEASRPSSTRRTQSVRQLLDQLQKG